jgi:hypothetical protein
MNEQSLKESNAILEAAVARSEVGQLIPVSPADLADDASVTNRLSAARAVRALMARGRIEREGDSYRLLDSRPLDPGEPATVRRPIRRRRGADRERAGKGGPPTYDQVGRLVIERLIELSAENAELRTSLERARSEAEAARREAMEITRSSGADRRRSQLLEDEIGVLKKRLEMTESNLRTVVQAAKDRPASPLDDGDAKAILDILSARAGE